MSGSKPPLQRAMYDHWKQLHPTLLFSEGEQIDLHLPSDFPPAAGGGELFRATFRGGKFEVPGFTQGIELSEGWWWTPVPARR